MSDSDNIKPAGETHEERARLALLSILEDEREAKRALMESEERWRLLVETSPDFIALHDLEGRFLYLNKYAKGFSEKDTVGRSLYDFVAPESRESYRRAFEECVRTHDVRSLEYTAFGGEGKMRAYESTVVPIIKSGAVQSVMAIARDITERKRAENALLESEERFRNLVEGMSEGLIQVDNDDRIIYVNRSLCDLLGYLPGELLGETGYELLVPAEYRSLIMDKNRLRLQGASDRYESRMRKKTGEIIDIEIGGSSVRDASGEVVGSMGVITDISARRKAENQLRYQADLLNNVSDAILATDRQFRVRYWNKAAEKQYGWKETEVMGRHFADFIQPRYPTETRWSVMRRIAREGKWSGELEHNRRDGTWFPVLATVSEVTDNDGAIIGHVAVNRDISERKRAENALQESEERFRTFFENTFVGIYRTTPVGRILMANPALVTMLGYVTFEEMAERNLEEGGYVPGYRREDFKRLLEDGDQMIGHEAQWTKKDGKTLWVRENARVVRDRTGAALYYEGTVEDITQQKRAESEKAQMEDELRQSQKMEAIGQLAGGVAHDFNNMLAGIMGNAEMLYGRLTKNPELAKMAEQIISGAEHAAKLTKQLLAFSRKGEIQRAPVDVHRVVGETAGILANTIDRRIAIEQNLRASPSIVMGDHSQLENMLLNLGLNSRDAMPRGGRLTFATETVEMDADYVERYKYRVEPGRYIKIEVDDSGSGMDEEVHRHIFEPFFTTKEPGKGTGLGLASAYGTVKNHGGHIECYSEPGHGTVMKIYLPVHDSAEKVQKGQREEREACPEGKVRACILVVDDEELVRGMTEQVLRTRGYEVLTAVDGEEALGVYQAWHREIDLVILDMIMPKMSGRETFMEMKKLNPGIKAILSSGFSEDGEAREVLRLGIRGFVQKPFRMEELLQKVGEALG